MSLYVLLWIRIRIGSEFNDFVDPNWAKMQDPCQNPDWSQSGSTTLNNTVKKMRQKYDLNIFLWQMQQKNNIKKL
jgi:hypothetical protein